MKISIITIGDEICIGQIVNTNAAWIAKECTELGAQVVCHLSTNDSKESIVDALDYVKQNSDYIIITGGLGPTHDDISKAVLSEYFESVLVFDQLAFDNMKILLESRNVEVSERNIGQAMLPNNCEVLINRLGTASGMQFNSYGKYFVSLPGVPYEMQALMSDYVLPHIKELMTASHEEIVKYKTLLSSGIPESSLANLLGLETDFLENMDSLAFLPSPKGVRLRIGCKASNVDIADNHICRIEEYIIAKAGKFIHTIGDGNLSETIGNILASKGLSLAVAESCTAGMLGSEITSVAGASRYFLGGEIVYTNQAKMEQLAVRQAILEQHGAVSQEVAVALAVNVRSKYSSDLAISITGIAGPDGGSDEKPVGTVWIGLADAVGAIAQKFNFGSERQLNRERAVSSALYLLYKKINENID